MKIELKRAGISDIPLIQSLSEKIWKKHYIEIITMEQIEYMLQKMYSIEKLTEEINNPSYEYHIAFVDETASGYIAISDMESQFMLHKFYLLEQNRYAGVGEKVFNQIFRKKEKKAIQLFVNRQNFKSVNFYFKMGFRIQNVIDNNIGDGYYMNDFIMFKQ